MKANDSATSSFPVIDIAIIGGGVAGTYAAYRLIRSNPKHNPVLRRLLEINGKEQLDIKLFEWSERIGGRLWSLRLPQCPSLLCELGGLSFSQSQQNVYGLCTQELNLEISPFSVLNQLQYFRGNRFHFNQYSQPDTVPYQLAVSEKARKPLELVFTVIDAIAPEATHLKGKALVHYLRTLEVDGHPLHTLGFWDLLAARLSTDAFKMVTTASGCFPTYSNWNAYNAFLSLMQNYAKDDPSFKVVNGFQTLPTTLAEMFVTLGGRIEKNTRLYSLEIYPCEGEELIALKLGNSHRNCQIQYARYVILAIPQRSLELLAPESVIFENPQFKCDLRTVTAQPAGKLLLSYRFPWWQQISPAIEHGRSDTDLSLRKCYYLGTESQPPHEGASLLLVSYGDDQAASCWNRYLAMEPGNLAALSPVPPAMVIEVQQQLRELHGSKIPEPSLAICQNWTAEPFGGGWHLWSSQCRSWEVISRIRQPVPGKNVFICGSAYSENQGWVEGALNTTERLLETEFLLPRPSWIDATYELGP